MLGSVFNQNGHVLTVPKEWYQPFVYDGFPIPSHALWAAVVEHLYRQEPIPVSELFRLAEEAQLYALQPFTLYLWTNCPRPSDQRLVDHLYQRIDRQRPRPLLRALDISVCKIETELDEIQKVVETFQKYQLYPVAFQDRRLYVASRPEVVWSYFGTDDHVRIAVYLKRPSGRSIELILK